jgi:hypothetical protein
MCALRIGLALPGPVAVFGRPLFLVLALVLTGCAQSTALTPGGWDVGAPQSPMADAGRPRVEMEADGLPAQAPPLRREPSAPDDPSEPFSPNYGPRPAAAPSVKAVTRTIIPNDLPPAFRRRLASAVGGWRARAW